MVTLVREKVRVEAVENQEFDSDLAARSQLLLFYNGHNLAAADEDKKRKSNAIREWLAERDIRPFQLGSVRRHMARKWLPSLIGFGIWCAITATAAGGWMLFASSLPTFLQVAGFIFGLVGSVAAALGILFQCSWHWQEVKFSDYRRPIPEFVLQTATDIVDKFHNCDSLRISELRINETSEDPFLVLNLPDGSKLYLEVWNEPGFKKTREV